MGRVHKKKLAEYAEAAEGEEQANKSTDKENDDDEETGSPEGVAADESEVEAEAQEGDTDAKNAENDEDDDFKSLQGDNAEQEAEENGGTANRKVNKRKVQEKPGKKTATDTADASSEDEPLNGSGAGASVAKRGRKLVGKAKSPKGAGKPGKQGKVTAGKKKASKESDDEVEEEYEVKEIVDHKVERGVSYFLIRWKGYTKDDDTWEPEDTLSCPDIIEKYKKKQDEDEKEGGKSPKKVASPSKKGRGLKITKEDPEKEWEVEKIIDYSEDKTGRVFRIRWKGFGSRHDTWEPEKNLFCEDKIQKFMERMKSQSNITFKELREEPKKTKRLVNESLPRTNYRNPIGRKSKRSVSKKRVYYGDSDE